MPALPLAMLQRPHPLGTWSGHYTPAPAAEDLCGNPLAAMEGPEDPGDDVIAQLLHMQVLWPVCRSMLELQGHR